MSRSYEPIIRPQHSFSNFLWRAIEEIWAALRQHAYYEALDMSENLLIFLPDPIKKKFEERANDIGSRLDAVTSIHGWDFYLTTRSRRQYLRRYSFQQLKPFLSEIISLLFDRGYLEEKPASPRRESKTRRMEVPDFASG